MSKSFCEECETITEAKECDGCPKCGSTVSPGALYRVKFDFTYHGIKEVWATSGDQAEQMVANCETEDLLDLCDFPDVGFSVIEEGEAE